MSLIVTDQNPYQLMSLALAWMGRTAILPPETRSVGVVDEDSGEIRAVFLYNAFYDDACHMHIASDHSRRWATRGVLETVFGLPFYKWGLNRVDVQIHEDNIATLITALKLGFRVDGSKPSAGNCREVLLSMTSADCRFWAQPKEPAIETSLVPPPENEEEDG